MCIMQRMLWAEGLAPPYKSNGVECELDCQVDYCDVECCRAWSTFDIEFYNGIIERKIIIFFFRLSIALLRCDERNFAESQHFISFLLSRSFYSHLSPIDITLPAGVCVSNWDSTSFGEVVFTIGHLLAVDEFHSVSASNYSPLKWAHFVDSISQPILICLYIYVYIGVYFQPNWTPLNIAHKYRSMNSETHGQISSFVRLLFFYFQLYRMLTSIKMKSAFQKRKRKKRTKILASLLRHIRNHYSLNSVYCFIQGEKRQFSVLVQEHRSHFMQISLAHLYKCPEINRTISCRISFACVQRLTRRAALVGSQWDSDAIEVNCRLSAKA